MAEKERKKESGIKAALLATAVLAAAGLVFHLPAGVHAAGTTGPQSPVQSALASQSLPKPVPNSVSLPMFFEPNQGQTAPQVKFLAHGAGYGLFLTADEAVLNLHRAAVKGQPSASSAIRMRLEGADTSARVTGASPLPGKSNYFIGNDPAQWRRDIPQFGRVEYQSVYPGIDLVYYGNQGQIEYDFRLAPGADPGRIALSFNGASARVVSASGDLVLSTANGDVRFHAPRIYQPAQPEAGSPEKTITGSFRQLADNKVGFAIGDYDRSRPLVIDPTLSYSTYFGGTGTESLVQVAVDSALNIYLAGSTDSDTFTLPSSNPVNAPLGGPAPNGTENIFIAKINPLNAGTGNSQLVMFTYLGGSGTDTLAGLAVDTFQNIYVAGTTTSPNFPMPASPYTNNTFQTSPTDGGAPAGLAHGFVSKISLSTLNLTYSLTYSTYLAGNGTDNVTGLAIDTSQNAYVTGDTTSSNPAGDNFPANPSAFQATSNSLGNPQFFATEINTNTTGAQSVIYSTYFGGGYFAGEPTANHGGGIAVATAAAPVFMYITGTTNMLGITGPNGQAKFPLFSPQQPCLNQPGQTACTVTNTNTDAFVAKIQPVPGASPAYSTFLGASGNDAGLGIAVDTSANAYIVGSTNSSNWVCSNCIGGFQPALGGPTATNGFLAKVGNLTGSVYPLTYFTYLGGSVSDVAQAVQVDSLGAAHIVGSTTSNLANLFNPISAPCLNTGDPGSAFVALIATTLSGQGIGDYLTCLGGSGLDQGTGVALDVFNATYVAGITQSSDFPVTSTAYQPTLPGPQAAFLTKLGAFSQLQLAAAAPSPTPVAAGAQVAFTFNITNQGPDTATNAIFTATAPSTGLASPPQGKVTTGTGTCSVSGSNVVCNIPTVAVCTGTNCTPGGTGSVGAAVEVDITPNITATANQVRVSGTVSANGGGIQASASQAVNVVNFQVHASALNPVINAGDTATIQATFCPTSSQGYNATITPSQSISPSMVTATTPTFGPTTVTLAGAACQTSTLTIATVARPVTTGTLFRPGSFRGSIYAAWLPIGGLSLIGLGVGVSRKRRRWLILGVLCVIAGVILLPGCSSSTNTTTSPGGTLAGQYTVTISGSAGAGSSQSYQVVLQVN